MGEKKKKNQGFSLIELLIAITILSIIMIMVSQFMSTTSGAYRKTKKNMRVQTEAMQVVEQLSDTLMQAEYVRVGSMSDGKSYTIAKNVAGNNERVVTEVTSATTIDYDLVPDNYGNYSKLGVFTNDNKVIVNFRTNEIVNEKGNTYPLSGDVEENQKVRSFRALKKGSDYTYIMPEYIYAEYTRTGSSGEETVHVMYYITPVDSTTGTRSMYLYKAVTSDPVNKRNFLYNKCKDYAKGVVGSDGLVTENLVDFYLSADSEGNALLTNLLFENGGYQYNAVETVNFRNSNVLTVRPQNLYKVAGAAAKTP